MSRTFRKLFFLMLGIFIFWNTIVFLNSYYTKDRVETKIVGGKKYNYDTVLNIPVNAWIPDEDICNNFSAFDNDHYIEGNFSASEVLSDLDLVSRLIVINNKINYCELLISGPKLTFIENIAFYYIYTSNKNCSMLLTFFNLHLSLDLKLSNKAFENSFNKIILSNLSITTNNLTIGIEVNNIKGFELFDFFILILDEEIVQLPPTQIYNTEVTLIDTKYFENLDLIEQLFLLLNLISIIVILKFKSYKYKDTSLLDCK